eukprot:Awhi_evm1s11186
MSKILALLATSACLTTTSASPSQQTPVLASDDNFVQCAAYEESEKIDCGYVGITEDQCSFKGCCWIDENQAELKNFNGPYCYRPIYHKYNSEAWKKRTVYQALTDRFAKDGDDKEKCSDLTTYCGGSYKGMIKKLDYIQGMGIDAIWISPIIENTDGGYHGYWAQNIYTLNENFGTEQDLVDLIKACHDRDIWVMVDVVGNHMGNQPGGSGDFSKFIPFNKTEHFHDDCAITDWNDDISVEHCRLSGLPDLNQDHPFVRQALKDWIRNLVNKYKIDGLRVDTVPEVKRQFWQEFVHYGGVYAIGEYFNGDMKRVAEYQNAGLTSVLHYPLYYALRNVFQQKKDMHEIANVLANARKMFTDTAALGGFIDNHDNSRFLAGNKDWDLYKNALAFILLGKHMPIIYYGTEQAFSGAGDPGARESLWPYYNTKHTMYDFIAKINYAKHQLGDAYHNSPFQNNFVDANFFSFSRGDILVLLTNVGSGSQDVTRTFKLNQQKVINDQYFCSIFADGEKILVKNNQISIRLKNGLPKVYKLCDKVAIPVTAVHSDCESSYRPYTILPNINVVLGIACLSLAAVAFKNYAKKPIVVVETPLITNKC